MVWSITGKTQKKSPHIPKHMIFHFSSLKKHFLVSLHLVKELYNSMPVGSDSDSVKSDGNACGHGETRIGISMPCMFLTLDDIVEMSTSTKFFLPTNILYQIRQGSANVESRVNTYFRKGTQSYPPLNVKAKKAFPGAGLL